MSTLNTFIDCPALQTQLTNLFEAEAGAAGINAPIVQAILARENTNRVLMREVSPRGNKLKTVQAVYSQRRTIGDVTTDTNIACSGGEVAGETSIEFDLDPEVGSKPTELSIRAEDLIRRCEDDNLYLARQIRDMQLAALAHMDSVWAAKIVAHLGNFASDVDQNNPAGTTAWMDVKTKNTTSGAILTDAYEVISFENKNNDWAQTPLVFGGGNWERYAKAIGAACCGANGVNAKIYADANPYKFIFARNIEAAAGTDRAVAVIPGTVQPLIYNRYRGTNRQNLMVVNDDSFKQGTIPSVIAGFELDFDYKAKLDCATNTWTIGISIAHDLAFMPDDMFKVGDRLEGVNGITGFEIDN